ncbi:hypothetical protein U1Q18_013803 [Sarracenia purpurea var. burkii]
MQYPHHWEHSKEKNLKKGRTRLRANLALRRGPSYSINFGGSVDGEVGADEPGRRKGEEGVRFKSSTRASPFGYFQPGRGAQSSRAFRSTELAPTPSNGSSSVEPNPG